MTVRDLRFVDVPFGWVSGVAWLLVGLSACGKEASPVDLCLQLPTEPPWAGQGLAATEPENPVAGLRLNEVQSRNNGTWIDEIGETDDWVEVFNAGSEPLQLQDYWLTDESGVSAVLGLGEIAPGEALVLFADDEPGQGCGHLPFKVSGAGEQLVLQDSQGRVLDELIVPAMLVSEVYVRFGTDNWQICRYGSPGLGNPETCVPPSNTSVAEQESFEDFQFSEDRFLPPPSLAISAVNLRPAEGQEPFIQLVNSSDRSVSLGEVVLELKAHLPGNAWPLLQEGSGIALEGGESLEPGERRAFAVPSSVLDSFDSLEAMEAVVSLFVGGASEASHRIDFMSLPEQAVLAQLQSGRWRLCEAEPQASSDWDWSILCEGLPERQVGERLRHLLTPTDFSALASGTTKVGIQSVKFVHELRAPGLVHLLSAASYPLHYTFVRRRIYRAPDLDRCDVDENEEFDVGWAYFSDLEYRRLEGRQFLLGTLSKYGAADLNAVEYTYGDEISAEWMRLGLLEVVAHTEEALTWSLRPQDARQVRTVRAVEGTVPIVGPKAPFQGLTYQTLSYGVGFGTLRFVPAAELATAILGPEVILITDSVPNDIPLVGGLVTEAFQTPLAHVNVLSQSRGTPNASLLNAREKWTEYLGQLVRLEVGDKGVTITLAAEQEAQEYWQTQRSPSEAFEPRLDKSVRGPQDLAEHSLQSLPALGAKASQLAELMAAGTFGCGSSRGYAVPERAFAVPVFHFVEHADESGASAALRQAQLQPEFEEQAAVRAESLEVIRALILEHPVDEKLLTAVRQAVFERFGDERVRFRSSSNAEDLSDFSGAGLYTSRSAEANNPDRAIDDALRTVWASLYNQRAYDERRLANVQEGNVAMGVLVHRAFRDERANGVAISRNLLEPTRGDQYFINSQAGEASVTNPAPGIGTEQVVYQWGRQPSLLPQSQSSLLPALGDGVGSVLTPSEVEAVACALRTVHRSFRPLLDPERDNRWFAMEVEFKFVGSERKLLLKQARPHSFGREPAFEDCREF